MNNIGIFIVAEIAFSFPWQIIVMASSRKTVVAYADNQVIVIYYTSSILGIGVFRALGNHNSHVHKSIIPGKITKSFVVFHIFIDYILVIKFYQILIIRANTDDKLNNKKKLRFSELFFDYQGLRQAKLWSLFCYH